MLKVTIELWPGGDKTRSKIIGVGGIANNGTGNRAIGNYIGYFEDEKSYESSIQGFPRRLGPWKLLFEVLKNIVLCDRKAGLITSSPTSPAASETPSS